VTGDRWTVRPGECFWTTAESVLTQAWGRAPTDAEIVPYWNRLIEANRASLAHTDNPDLIFPAQVFEIPAP
jgi:nucleoid-associated protein YgaU